MSKAEVKKVQLIDSFSVLKVVGKWELLQRDVVLRKSI